MTARVRINNPIQGQSGLVVEVDMGDGTYRALDATSLDALGGYTEYIALLTQTGETAPVATIIKNTLGQTPTWSRTGSGAYRLTANPAAWTANKTICPAGFGGAVSLLSGADSINQYTIVWSSTTVIDVYVSGGDGAMTTFVFWIRVYA